MANNTVTFYQGGNNIRSLRLPAVAVEVDGLPAPWLELEEVIRSRGPQLNQGRFVFQHHKLGPEFCFENVSRLTQPGQKIRAILTCMADSATGNQLSWPIFSGVIVRSEAAMAGDSEDVEIIACDELAYQSDEVIDGERVLGAGNEPVWTRTCEVVFNPDGGGNCSSVVSEINGRSYHVFDANERTACFWSYEKAVRYIASEHLAVDTVSLSSLSAFGSETEGLILRDVDVFGLTALEAIERICRRAGFYYGIEHAPAKDGGVKEVLYFYRQGLGREIFLRHQKKSEALDLSRTNIARCRLEINSPRETIQVIGHGAVKRFESTFELVEGWDQSLEINDYELYSPSTNTDFAVYADVFRKYVLNEAGDYSGSPYNQGGAYDFSGVFGTGEYSVHRRRFLPGVSRNPDGETFGYYVEVSYNAGNAWQPYGGSFNILLDECGIYLSGNQLEAQTWVAICKDTLRFRITAAVDGDEPLEAVISDGPVDCTRRVRRIVFDLGNEYKYRKVTSGSIFTSGAIETGPADTADDSENMRGHLRDQLARIRQNDLAGTAELTFVRPDIWPGDVVKRITGREVDLEKLSGPGEIRPQVEKVHIKLSDKWMTTVSFG